MGIRSPGISIKIPESRFFFSHMSKKPNINIPNLLLAGSPPSKPEEAFERELDRSRKEFNQFNQDLDEIAHSMEKLFEDAPEWLANIEEIKRKQDSVEECILATQEKIFENENHLEKLKSIQNEVTEDINNDLKKIQEQIFDILEKHRCARLNVSNIYNNQSKTSEQLDLMLQAIHEYARLIREASLTIKHFDDVGSPLKYESLDLSPFIHYKGSSSYFEDHIYEPESPISPISPISRVSPMLLPSASTTTTHTSASTPTSLDTDSSDPSPLSLKDSQPPHSPIHPLPSYQIKHQKLLLLSMRRAAVGLKFLLYANQLNDYKNECPDSDCDLDLDLFDDTSTEEVVTTTYKDIVPDCKDLSSKSSVSSTGSCDSSDSGGSDHEKSEKSKESTPVQVETEPTLSPTSTLSEVAEGGGDTDEGPEYDDDFYEQLEEIELEKSDSSEDGLHGDTEDELGEVDLEESSSQAIELQDVSYFSSSGDEKEIEKFDRNLSSFRSDEKLDLKALDASEFDINELQGLSREGYREIVGESSLMDDDDTKQDFVTKIKRTRHRKIDISGSQGQQREKDSKSEQLIQQELLQEKQIHREQEQKSKQSYQLQEKERQQKQQMREKVLKENEERLRLQLEEEKKLKEQLLRQEYKRESQRLLQEEPQLQIQGQNLLQSRSKKSSSFQSSTHENIFKSGIKSQNEPITPTTPSLSMKSFHLPDISLSQQSDVREFRRMSNIFGNSDKGPIAALRTLTDNYRQLELGKQNADMKADLLEKQLEQYRQLLREEQIKSKFNRLESSDTKKGSSQGKFTSSEKEKNDSSVASLQKKYKAMKRQLEYMKTYSRKAEDERDEAKKALVKTQQDIAQMNDQFESLRASVQMPNKRTQPSNIFPTQLTSSMSLELPTKPLLSEKTIKSSKISKSKENIDVQENKQIVHPKENIRDSGSDKSKSREKVDPEQIKKIQEEIENSSRVRENLRKQRQAMENTHRKKAALESEKTSRKENEEGSEDEQLTKFKRPQQFVVSHKEELRNQHKFEDSYKDSRKNKKQPSNDEENRYIDSHEQQYDEACGTSGALNKRTINKMQFSNQYDDYREHYEDNMHDDLYNRCPSRSSTFTESSINNQYIGFRRQQRYNEKQERDNHFMRLPKDNGQYFDTRKDESFSEQEDGGQFPHTFRRQRQFMDEDSDIHPNDLRQSPTRDGRLLQYSNESRDNVYTHIKGRKRYDYTYENSEEESDYVEDRDYREELDSGEQSTSLQQDYPIWRDIKNSRSYLRKRNCNEQKLVPPNPKPMRSGNNGREIPFILGTGTGKSHSVTVNLQKAFALLTNHNPNSCSVCSKKNTNKNISKKQAAQPTRSERKESPDIALGRVVSNLMDEFQHLKIHYSNLVEEYQKIDPLDSKSKRSALTEEMKEVMDQMEMKGDQITTLYDIQQKNVKPSSSKSRYGLKSTTHGKNSSQKPTRSIHETRAENLNLLRGTQRVQKTLNDL